MRNLSRGDRGKEVLDVQTRLRGQGFELGREGVDGFFGPGTELAVRSFQQRRGLLVDGVVGANTWRELVEAGYSLGDRLLYLREPPFRGDDVLALQVKLNLLGFNAGAERGVHDDDVERAVLDFQRNAGLPPDGIVGESTIVKFEALRKAESGREGKKIPERDGGYVQAPQPAGTDGGDRPGARRRRRRLRLRQGRDREGLRPGARAAPRRAAARRGLPRAAHARTRRGGPALRGGSRRPTPPAPTSSSRCTPGRRGAGGARLGLLLFPAQPLLLRARPPPRRVPRGAACRSRRRTSAASGATTASCARRAASPCRSSRCSSATRTKRTTASRPDHVETLARALVGGLADYLARAPRGDDPT